jgi:CBS domain-containing protein/sporulation protein YlmC with PRC-barrel domain
VSSAGSNRRPRWARTINRPSLAARRAVAGTLISTAGLAGRPVRDSDGTDVGRVVDLVVRWDRGVYPLLTGMIVRVGFRRAWLHAEDIQHIDNGQVRVSSAKFDLREYERRAGEWLVRKDLLDHQLLDVDGARVVRAADLYLSQMGSTFRLVGVDVSFTSFLRRVLPGSAGRTATASKVVDWASIQSFGRPGEPVRLRETNRGLQQLRPAQLADLLEDLARPERQLLLSLMDPDAAADVMEEMEPEELEEVLRDAPVERAAALIARMEPDEAVDALRDLPEEDRRTILQLVPPDRASQLTRLLGYPEGVAGGIMTTSLVILELGDTIAVARRKALDQRANQDVTCLVVVDEDGRLVDDLPLMDMIAAEPTDLVADVIGPPIPGTVLPEASLDDVVEELIANRESSLLVVDEDGRPLGRILADDVVDALVESRSSRRWPWQPPRLGE